jgi:arylsulfatase A-like enzyme
MVHSMDEAVGKLLDEIDRQGIADHTAIIFMSDNGGNMYDHLKETTKDGKPYTTFATSNAPLRGGKATVFEGGIREPCVVIWPGVTKPGTRSKVIIQSTDFYPTILAQLGIALPKNHIIDGVDITPALLGKKYDRKPMFTYFPHAPKVPDWSPAAVDVHVGDWKLIRLFYQGEKGAHGYKLFNLKDDISEKNNLAAKFPDRVKQMDLLIENYLKEAGTVIPQPNPEFDPSKYHPELIGVQANAK